MFKNHLPMIALLALALPFQALHADDAADAALLETIQCLKSQNCASAKTGAGQAADQKALQAAGGNAAGKQALYDISADIMPVLLQNAGGDPEKMQAILQKAQTDPEAFFNSLPADIQSKIQSAAETIEKK